LQRLILTLDAKDGEAAKLASQKENFDIDEVQANTPEKVDDLYQSDSYLELINISYILSELKNHQ
jgi:hypothetical protein